MIEIIDPSILEFLLLLIIQQQPIKGFSSYGTFSDLPSLQMEDGETTDASPVTVFIYGWGPYYVYYNADDNKD